MPAQEEETKPVTVRPEPERDLAVWTAPARPFKRWDRKVYTTLISIAGIVGLILFLVEGFMPVVLLVSIIFFFYITSTVEPDKIQYKITNRGIKIGEKTTDWGVMNRFWFTKRFDSELLVVETIVLPGRMEMVVNPEDKEQIKKALVTYIPEEEVPPTFIDKASNWFSKKLPQS